MARTLKIKTLQQTNDLPQLEIDVNSFINSLVNGTQNIIKIDYNTCCPSSSNTLFSVCITYFEVT